MPDTLQPIRIEPDAFYGDGDLRLLLDITSATLVRARREGRLRSVRRGKRVFYLGRWVLDWLTSDSGAEASCR